MLRSYTINPAKFTCLGDGVYARRWHGNGATGVELGVRNGEVEFEHIYLSPTVIQALFKYLYVEGHQSPKPVVSTTPPADERAA